MDKITKAQYKNKIIFIKEFIDTNTHYTSELGYFDLLLKDNSLIKMVNIYRDLRYM